MVAICLSGSTTTLSFPFNLIRARDFLAYGEMTQHERVRDDGKLIVIDLSEDAFTFRNDRPIVFFSHQWTAFNHPDHTNKQFDLMAVSLTTLCESRGWDMEAVVVWCDYTSVPQVHSGLQGLAIDSLAAYASIASAFVIVAPDVPHKDLPGVICNEDTYRNRMWCRAEQLCHSLRKGTKNMLVANGKGQGGIMPMDHQWFRDAHFVFDGEATCCRLKHKNMRGCDRELLLKPILGLFGELYAGREDPVKNELWNNVKAQKDVMFPKEFTYACNTWNSKLKKEVETQETRPLFANLIQHIEDLIDEDEATRTELKGVGKGVGNNRDSADLRRISSIHAMIRTPPPHARALRAPNRTAGAPIHGAARAAVSSSAVVPAKEDNEMTV